MVAAQTGRYAGHMGIDAGFNQPPADGLLDLRRVGSEGPAFASVGATAGKRVASFFGVVLGKEVFVFVVG